MNPQLQDSFCVFSFPACGSLFQPVLQPYQGKSEPVIEMLAVSNSTIHAWGWKGLLQIRTALRQLIEVCSRAGCPSFLCCFPCSIPSEQQAMAILFTFMAFVLGGSPGTSLIAWEQVFVPLLSDHSGQRGQSPWGARTSACPLSLLS